MLVTKRLGFYGQIQYEKILERLFFDSQLKMGLFTDETAVSDLFVITYLQKDYPTVRPFSPNPLKLLDRGFEKLASGSLESIEYKELIEMTEPRE